MTQPHAPTTSENWITTLPELGLLELSGDDAPKFLQGQVTCDVLSVTDQTSTLGALCNAKGRVLTVFRLFKRESRFILVLPRQLVHDIAKRLRMYVLRSKVEIVDLDAEQVCLGMVGGIDRLGIPPAEISHSVTHGDGYAAVPVGTADRNRTLLIATAATAQRLLQQAEAADFTKASAENWALEEIRSGTPTVLPGTVEAFIPQMLNLDLLGGISFKKGCYTGQEVVARTHYLGAVKRRMYRLSAMSGAIPEPGAPLFADAEEQSAGTVVCAARDADGQLQLLAVLNSEPNATAPLRLERDSDQVLTITALPYIGTTD